MKILANGQYDGTVSLQLVAETDVEYAVLCAIWRNGAFERGDGDTEVPDRFRSGARTGFYLKAAAKEPPA